MNFQKQRNQMLHLNRAWQNKLKKQNEKMEKMKIKEKEFYIIDAILIVITLAGLIVIGGYATPLVISPNDKFETTNMSILFSFEKANAILIDDNLNFTSPDKIYVTNN